MTDVKTQNTYSLIRRILQTALILGACTFWLVFVIHCWNKPAMPNASLLEPLFRWLGDTARKQSITIYLGFAGFLFVAFYMTVLLPDLMRRFFPLKGKKLLVFRIIITGLVCAAAYVSILGCTNRSTIPEWLEWLSPGNRFSQVMKPVNLGMIPLGIFLILFCWGIPAAVHTLVNVRKNKTLNAAAVKKTLAFYALLAAVAFLVTAASAALLAVVGKFAPGAPDVVVRMEQRDAVNVSGIFVTALLAPVTEEIAFRGLIQHHARRVLPAIPAILLASVFFGLWHRNIGQFVYTFTWAVLFGLIYNATGKVRHTILMHALGNLLAVLSYSTANNAVLGRYYVLPAARAWLMALPLVPAILMLLLIAALLYAVMEAALCLATGKENRLIRLIRRRKK